MRKADEEKKFLKACRAFRKQKAKTSVASRRKNRRKE